MQRDEVLKIANDMAFMANIWIDDECDEVNDLVKFANLVAAKARKELREEMCYSWVPPHFVDLAVASERDACAKVCDAIDKSHWGCEVKATWCSDAIRARGEA